MKYKNIRKIHQGEYITRYNIEYEAASGTIKDYEIISRNPDIMNEDDLHNCKVDAVVMIIHDKTGSRILLNCEYRMAVGEWVYNFPAGLIDEGETAAKSAERELREETGLILRNISEEWKESYSAVGFSNEKTVVVVGEAEGEIFPSDSEMEEIQAGWYTKDEIQKLLQTGIFAARTQAYCAVWSRM